jgi:putative lipoprotein
VLEAGTSAENVEILVQLVAGGNGAAGASEVGRTFVFDCDGDVSFTVRTGPGEVALWAPQSVGGQYVVLGMTRSASGARYEDGDTVYWNRGELATFEIAGQRFIDCRSNPRKVPWADAARRGVTFRALGNEPSWYLEIREGRLAMVTELGSRRTELAYEEPLVAGRRATYRAAADGHELVAVVERTACTDSMSGEAFEATATVTFDDAMFYGCGRFL